MKTEAAAPIASGSFAAGSAQRRMRRWIPPAILDAVRSWLGRPAAREWEKLPAWPPRETYRGWDVPQIARFQKQQWNEFLAAVEGVGPLGVSFERIGPTRASLPDHNTVMAFAYVVARAARGGESLSVLDWGGGLGHWFVIARALFPDLRLAYTIHDYAEPCRIGSELLPEVTFAADARDALDGRYDLVVASSSLQYSEHWRDDLDALAAAARSYLYATRMPFVGAHPSFVVLQRPDAHGYETEYPGWVLQRAEFLAAAAASGCSLVREFLIAESIVLPEVAERCHYGGFLFARSGVES